MSSFGWYGVNNPMTNVCALDSFGLTRVRMRHDLNSRVLLLGFMPASFKWCG